MKNQVSLSPTSVVPNGSIFCCSSIKPVMNDNPRKTYENPNHEIHDALFYSFLAYAIRRQKAATLMALIMGHMTENETQSLPSRSAISVLPAIPIPVLTPESLKNNPLTKDTPYVVHVTCRVDFGPVYSHRYFVCPENLSEDWIELSLEQWFSEGESFKLKAAKLDLKCEENSKFFRLVLLPNLSLRGSRGDTRGTLQIQ